MCDQDTSDVEVSHILDAAEWARQRLERDSLGYDGTRQLAMTLREFDKNSEAIEQFKLASSLQEYNWQAQWGLALCYGNQKEWGLAIEMLEDAKNTIKSSDHREDYKNLPQLDRALAKCIWETGDGGKAFAIYEQILRDHPTDYEAALEMVLCFQRDQNSEGLIEFLSSLKNSMDDEQGLDRRTQTFHTHSYDDNFHEALLSLAVDDKTFDAIFDGYKTAIASAKQKIAEAAKTGADTEYAHWESLAVLLKNFGMLCYENSSENLERRKLAEDQWEEILEIETPFEADLIGYIKTIVCGKLAKIYFNEACQDPSDAEDYLERLKQLASTGSKYAASFGRSGAYPIELTARYYSLQGDNQKAIDTLRSEVKHNMDILSDDDPLNDWQGYHTLARCFMFAGQDADSLAAWSLITPLHDREVQADSAEAKANEGPLNDVCDGDCETQWTFADDIYMCRECDYMQFDLRCLDKLREGTLGKRICGKDHSMLHVPAYDIARQEKVGEGNVLVDEKIIPVSEWLQSIRQKWGLE